MKIFSLVLFFVACYAVTESQDCSGSDLLLDPGEQAIDVNDASDGVPLAPFPMPATIFEQDGDKFYVTVYQDTRICMSVQAEADCQQHLMVFVNDMAFGTPTINRGQIYYRETTDGTELMALTQYLCADFSTQQAVVITYNCLGDAPDGPYLTFQVIAVTGQDKDGVSRTIILINMAHPWDPSSVLFSSIGQYPNLHYFAADINQTVGYDVTNSKGWTTPGQAPEIPATCPSTDR